MLSDNNKFKGLRYCAVSSNNKLLSIELTRDKAYHKAIIAGEPTPYIFKAFLIKDEPHNQHDL